MKAHSQPTNDYDATPTHDDVPESVHETLQSPGETLADPTRRSLESRFQRDFSGVPTHGSPSGELTVGESNDAAEQDAQDHAARVGRTREGAAPTADFSGVKVHTGPQAAQSAKELGARAYAVDDHVVFGEGEYQPGTDEGDQLIAHELTHVAQPDAPGTIRRVGFFEAIARFFGGGTFSDRELEAYLAGLEAFGRIEDENDSDNKARVIVERHMHRDQSIEVRMLLIEEVLTGYRAGSDQDAALQIVEDASPAERERIREELGERRILPDRIDGDRRDRLYLLLRNRSTSVQTNWAMRFNLLGIGSGMRVMLNRLIADPEGDSIHNRITVNDGEVASDPTGTVLGQNVEHPRSGGRGFLEGDLTRGTEAESQALPGTHFQTEAPYAPVSLNARNVTANLTLQLGRRRVGERTQAQSTGTATTQQQSQTQTNTQSQSTTEERGISDTRSQSVGVEEGASTSATRSRGRTRGTSSSETEGTTQGESTMETEGTERTTGSETRTDTRELYRFQIGGGIDPQLRGQIGAGGTFSGNGALLGRLLGLAGPQGRVAAAAIEALGLLDDTEFEVNANGEGGFTLDLNIEGQARYEYERTVTEIQRNSRTDSESTARTESSESSRSRTEGTSSTESAGASATAGRSRSRSAQAGRSSTRSASTARTQGSSRSQSRTTGSSTSDTTSETTGRSDYEFDIYVEEASVEFEVEE